MIIIGWTKEERKALENAYATKTPIHTIELLKDKKRNSIVQTARQMGLNTRYPEFDYMVGLQFGKLEVVKKLEKNPNNHGDYLYECKCNCGNPEPVIASGGHLRNGDTKSCGCIIKENAVAKIKDLTGKKFGYLTVLELDKERYVSPNGSVHTKWICQCDCGNIVSIDTNSLRRGTKSCGCKSAEIAKQTKLDSNVYDISGEYGIGYDKNDNTFYFDIDDYEKIKNYTWYLRQDGYVGAHLSNNQTMLMHRFIMNVLDNDDIFVDHIHAERKNDNRKSNLRLSTKSQNEMNIPVRSNNTSGVTGISYAKQNGKWHAYISKDGIRDNLGWFECFDDAVAARKFAEENYFGDRSYDNSQAITIV